MRNAQASTKQIDIVGIFAVLSNYIETCIPKEDPQPLDKMLAVAHAARIAGIDITGASFKREVAKRAVNLTSVAQLSGTRRWCETVQRQVNADYEMLQSSEQH